MKEKEIAIWLEERKMNRRRLEETEISLLVYALDHIREYAEKDVSEDPGPVLPIEVDGKVYYPHKKRRGECK